MWDTNSNPKCPTFQDNFEQGVSGRSKVFQVFQCLPGPTPSVLRPTKANQDQPGSTRTNQDLISQN